MSETIVEVKGLRELSEALKQLPEKIAGKILGESVKQAAIVVRDQARANARASFSDPTGATEKSIVAYRKKGSTPKSITYQVGVTMKKKWPNRRMTAASGTKGRTGNRNWPAFWWIYTEFGARPHTIRAKMGKVLVTPSGGLFREVQHPGIKGKGWFTRSWIEKSSEALTTLKKYLKQGINIAVETLPKYTGK